MTLAGAILIAYVSFLFSPSTHMVYWNTTFEHFDKVCV